MLLRRLHLNDSIITNELLNDSATLVSEQWPTALQLLRLLTPYSFSKRNDQKTGFVISVSPSLPLPSCKH